MKIFITADMETVSGLINHEQTSEMGLQHQQARELMTGEVNAAVEGALEAGSTEIVVCDSHFAPPNLNIIAEKLNPEAYLVNGLPRPLGQLQGIDRTFDAAILIGYHAMSQTRNAVMDHTFMSNAIDRLKLNGIEVGEIGLNTYMIGSFDVPVVFASGDAASVEEAKRFSLGIETAVLKWPIGRYAAKALHPFKARDLIKQGVKRALKRKSEIKPSKLSEPVTVDVTLMSTGMADLAELIPTVERIDGKTVRFSSENIVRAYKTFQAVYNIASKELEKFAVFARS